MGKLITWVETHGNWRGSDLTLPAVDVATDSTVQRWCVVAGGLALAISRARTSERSSRFVSCQDLYAVIRRRLRQGQSVCASAELLSEVMHELADVADPLTRNCLKACFLASVGAPSEAAGPAGERSARGHSIAHSQSTVPQALGHRSDLQDAATGSPWSCVSGKPVASFPRGARPTRMPASTTEAEQAKWKGSSGGV